MKNNYNKIAWFYDLLKYIVYGKQIDLAEKHFISTIPENAKVLIIGGGSGSILPYFKAKTEITFIDQSDRMIQKARTRITNAKIEFIIGNETSIPSIQFDYIITNFFLDLFDESQLRRIIKTLSDLHVEFWINTDFTLQYNPSFIHKALEKVMYLFFKITTNIEASQLLNFEFHLNEFKLQKIDSKLFYNKFIETSCWQRKK